MWITYGIIAGLILGFYDFWTKKATYNNNIMQVVFWSSLFGMLAWLPFLLPISGFSRVSINISDSTITQQLLIFIKSIFMTLSWALAYYSVRELPMSFSGAIRASGPIWTLLAGIIVFNEFLSPIQFTAVLLSIFAYFFLSLIGKREGIYILRSKPILIMLIATILSALTTVYDKYIIQILNLSIIDVQAYSAIQRFVLASILYLVIFLRHNKIKKLKWSFYIPLVGLSWVIAEFVYFMAIIDPEANVTYLSIFRRMSLVVGFFLSVLFIGEKNILRKLLIITMIVFSAVLLIITK